MAVSFLRKTPREVLKDEAIGQLDVLAFNAVFIEAGIHVMIASLQRFVLQHDGPIGVRTNEDARSSTRHGHLSAAHPHISTECKLDNINNTPRHLDFTK